MFFLKLHRFEELLDDAKKDVSLPTTSVGQQRPIGIDSADLVSAEVFDGRRSCSVPSSISFFSPGSKNHLLFNSEVLARQPAVASRAPYKRNYDVRQIRRFISDRQRHRILAKKNDIRNVTLRDADKEQRPTPDSNMRRNQIVKAYNAAYFSLPLKNSSATRIHNVDSNLIKERHRRRTEALQLEFKQLEPKMSSSVASNSAIDDHVSSKERIKSMKTRQEICVPRLSSITLNRRRQRVSLSVNGAQRPTFSETSVKTGSMKPNNRFESNEEVKAESLPRRKKAMKRRTTSSTVISMPSTTAIRSIMQSINDIGHSQSISGFYPPLTPVDDGSCKRDPMIEMAIDYAPKLLSTNERRSPNPLAVAQAQVDNVANGLQSVSGVIHDRPDRDKGKKSPSRVRSMPIA